jgi:hypothetical protein
MPTTAGYTVRRTADAPIVPCPCGDSTRVLTAADGGPCSLHVTSIRDSVRHYHRETTPVGRNTSPTADSRAGSPAMG